MSERASGSIAQFLTFSERKSGSQVRWQKKQNDILSASRIDQRAKFSRCVGWWNTLLASEKAEWQALSLT